MATYSIEQDEAIQVERNPWVDNVLRPALIIAMIMCLNVAVVNLVWLANPEWNGAYFLGAMLLTTIEGIYSYRVLHHYRSRGMSVVRYRLVEMGVLVLLLKLLTLLGKSWPAIQAELRQIWANPKRL